MLVVGATRILRPAVRTLVDDGATVVAVARSTADLEALAVEVGAVVPVAADCLDAGSLGDTLARRGLRPAAALLYCPTAGLVVHRRLAALVDGPAVQLLPSGWAAPDAAAVDLGGPVLQLGWTGDPPRWHTPAEISMAALDVLSSGVDAVLGRVRPWQERPR